MQKLDLSQRDKTDSQLFNEVFNNFASRYKGLGMSGTIVTYKGEEMFNIDGYNLLYNLLRLTKMLEDAGELR